MSVAKVIEISATSPDSFDAAVAEGIRRAATTVKNIQGAWVKEQQVTVSNGRIDAYRVNLKITFLLEGDD
jgi:flavin-binding protein dodecin